MRTIEDPTKPETLEEQAGTQILTVIADRVKSTSESFSVYAAHEPDALLSMLTVKQFVGPVQQGQRWTVCGEYKRDPKWGQQFVAQFATLGAPTTRRELELFLTSGLVDGWSWREAGNVLDKFEDPIQVIEQEPHRLLDVNRITEELLGTLQAAWARGKGMAPIYAQLSAWGIDGRMAEKVVKEYGFHTTARLEDNPYQAIFDVDGFGWKSAESVARHLGIDARDRRRVEAGVALAVAMETWTGGHTWVTLPVATQAASALLQLPAEEVGERIQEAVEADLLIQEAERIYPSRLYNAERSLAASIARRLDRKPLVAVDAIDHLIPASDLTQEQWSAVCMALTNTVSLLTGGPGCGKTTCIKSLIAAAQKLQLPVTCMAPTGKAAVRMREATGYPATTIHKRCGISPSAQDLDADIEPLTGLVVIDETSMLDTIIASIVFRRISQDAHVLLVGDPDQLPSVGPGAILRDLIAADVLTRVHLTRVFRNDAGVAVNAARIRAGETIVSLPDCRLISAATPEAAQQQIISLLQYEIPGRGFTPDDVLVLTPTNDGASGRHTLNTQLQVLLNGASAGQGITMTREGRQTEVRLGDKVIVNKNQNDLGVHNGETGRVVDIAVPRSITVEIDGRRVTFTRDDKRLVELAYAITGHKSQGSEAPVVIVPVFYSRVLSREWLYTVLTRARKLVYLVGDPAAMQACVRQVRVNDRRTSLVDVLREAVIESMPAGQHPEVFAWNGESNVYHTRRKAARWRTSCGIDTREDGWQFRLFNAPETVDLRPCLRCQASSGVVVFPFPDGAVVAAQAV